MVRVWKYGEPEGESGARVLGREVEAEQQEALDGGGERREEGVCEEGVRRTERGGRG